MRGLRSVVCQRMARGSFVVNGGNAMKTPTLETTISCIKGDLACLKINSILVNFYSKTRHYSLIGLGVVLLTKIGIYYRQIIFRGQLNIWKLFKYNIYFRFPKFIQLCVANLYSDLIVINYRFFICFWSYHS